MYVWLLDMSIGTDVVSGVDWLLDRFGLQVSAFIIEILASVLIFIIFITVGWIIYRIFERYLSKWAEKTKTKLDDEILRNIKTPIYFFVIIVGAYFGIEHLTFFESYSTMLTFIFTIVEILLITFIITRVVNVVIVWYSERRARKRMSEHILFIFKRIVNLFIFIIALLIILSVLNIDLTGVAVSLGIIGIAIAFALQNVLSDVFSAFSIYFDRPFEIGDFIIVDEYAGTVKKIGMKSTRVNLLQGEELVLSNRELTSKSVRNFKKMKKRRIMFRFGVTYDTPLKKLKKIPNIIQNIINDIEFTDIERVHFKEFGDFSLNFEVVYYMKQKDYIKFMDTQQEINFAIKDAFEKQEIDMAFPTQTIFLEK